MSSGTPGSEALFLRLLRAVLLPAEGRDSRFTPTVYEAPLAVLESPGDALALVLLDRSTLSENELGARVDRLLGAPVNGALIFVLVGGGEAERTLLADADRRAPDPNKLGVYHLNDEQQVVHVAGRRLGDLRAAARALLQTEPLDPQQLPELVAAHQRERTELAAFAERLRQRPSRLTKAVVAICVALFFASFAFAGGRGRAQEIAVLLMGANGRQFLAEGQWWRLLSYGFLHQEPWHLAANMMGLVGLGTFLEPLVGWRRFLIVYGGSIACAGLASAFLGRAEGFSIGASGGLTGLAGAGLSLMVWPRGWLPGRLAALMKRRMVQLLALNVLLGLVIRQIDHWAHLGGFAFGLAFGFAGGFGPAPRRDVDAPLAPREPLVVRALALAVGAVLVLAIVVGLTVGQPWQAADLLNEQRSSVF